MGLRGTYNKLNNTVVSRNKILGLIGNAVKLEDWEVYGNLKELLYKFPNAQEFELEVSPLPVKSLNGPSEDYSMLSGIPFLTSTEEKQFQDETGSLGKAVNSEQIYNYISEQVLKAIDKGPLPWRKGWDSVAKYGFPATNFVSKKPYRGINSSMLNLIYPMLFGAWNIPYFLTFKQIQKLKGNNKGAEAYRVFYFTKIFRYYQKNPKLEYSTSDPKKFHAWLTQNRSKFNSGQNTSIGVLMDFYSIPIIKYYNVYSADQITGIDWKLSKQKRRKFEPLESAELIVENYPKAPPIKTGTDGAFYAPRKDEIEMPAPGSFKKPQEYYGTLFHELVHSTGHSSRLKRDLTGRFGSKSYAFEELIAELGACFLNGESGTLYHTLDNSASYLASWRKKLQGEMKKDNRFFFKASSRAQAAVDHILNRDKDGVPAYLKKILKSKPKTEKPREPKRYSVKTSKKRKEQLALFGPKKKLSGPIDDAIDLASNVETTVTKMQTLSKKIQDLVVPISDLGKISTGPKRVFRTSGPVMKFLGKVEKKPKESVVMTIDADQGSGKTRFLFQLLNELAESGEKCLFLSMEEHPESDLFIEKRDQYVTKKAVPNLFVLGGVSGKEALDSLYELTPHFDVVAVDSWGKLDNAGLDDFRRSFDGKLFPVIYQRTTNGTMRGGSAAQFDADIVAKVKKDPDGDYRKNYVYFDKNRYQDKTGMKYFVSSRKVEQEKIE